MKVMGLIPALDAGETVGAVVAGAVRYMDEVLVVDDGSADDTGQRARGAGAAVVRHGVNQGKGAALKTGFEYALGHGYDAVVTLDADGQHDPDEIPKLIKGAEGGAGIVIGSRLDQKEKVPPARYWANMVGVRCISWRARCRLLDSQSGFRFYRASVLKGIKCSSTGFEAETELLIKAGRGGFRIASVPVRAIYGPEVLSRSHYRTVRDTYRICILFLKSFFWR